VNRTSIATTAAYLPIAPALPQSSSTRHIDFIGRLRRGNSWSCGYDAQCQQKFPATQHALSVSEQERPTVEAAAQL
jgi:hypothetical protein